MLRRHPSGKSYRVHHVTHTETPRKVWPELIADTRSQSGPESWTSTSISCTVRGKQAIDQRAPSPTMSWLGYSEQKDWHHVMTGMQEDPRGSKGNHDCALTKTTPVA